ncbi:restriction endonuclease subunit S [Vibrio parahaemolyticus]|uniref:restriction endonuclease subunit S n=1 Tax=Vibrio parahaemolyticus TaxID=670 RepID=UPI001122CF41|nr:restriction endonuclease subunit S [Vibrio parahaemolyticus]TOJ24055.1 restriction endonuclease subunit S [Vibrio parahaemolyticus]
MIWPQVSLTPALGRVVRGVTFSQSDSVPEQFEGGIPVLRAGNIQQELITETDLVWIPKKFVSEEQFLQLNDIVVCTSSGSASLVGKSAILEKEFKGTWGAFNAVIRCNPNFLNPSYMAFWMSSEAFRHWRDRHVQGANIQNIKQSSLETIRLPLPAPLEQKRIVQILQQAAFVTTTKHSINNKIDLLVRTAYWEFFSDWYQSDGLVDSIRIRDCIDDSQYGVSEAMEETGTHAVLRMNSITTSGWIDLSDLKYASLSEKDIRATELQDGDLLFNRTNSRELVGKCAIWRPVAGQYSYASYLVRLRLKPNMLPEFLWATLNSAYGKYRLFNSAKQAVSMANVSPTDLGRITVPLPPLELQEKFAKFVRRVEELRTQMLERMESYSELSNLVLGQALIGDLTSRWRKEHAEQLEDEARGRDALLLEQGAKIVSASPNTLSFSSTQDEIEYLANGSRLRAELSKFQRSVLNSFTNYCQNNGQPLVVEDPEVFARFYNDDSVTEYLQEFGDSLGNRIRRTLSQLASLGLIAKITLPKQNAETGEREYLKAFRPLREEEFTRMADIQQLRKTFSNTEEKPFYFEASLDYETSSSTGAAGMFQVIALTDEKGKDATHLIDQGVHYASLDDLKSDIADRLGISKKVIVLEVA